MINLVDFIADSVDDSSLAHSTVEGFIDYGNGKSSIISSLDCSKECLKGRYDGNFDIRNSRYEDGQFRVMSKIKVPKLTLNIASIKRYRNYSRSIIDSKFGIR